MGELGFLSYSSIPTDRGALHYLYTGRCPGSRRGGTPRGYQEVPGTERMGELGFLSYPYIPTARGAFKSCTKGDTVLTGPPVSLRVSRIYYNAWFLNKIC